MVTCICVLCELVLLCLFANMGPKRKACDEAGNVAKRQRKVTALWEKVKACSRNKALWEKVKGCGRCHKGMSGTAHAHSFGANELAVRTPFDPITSSYIIHSKGNRSPNIRKYYCIYIRMSVIFFYNSVCKCIFCS